MHTVHPIHYAAFLYIFFLKEIISLCISVFVSEIPHLDKLLLGSANYWGTASNCICKESNSSFVQEPFKLCSVKRMYVVMVAGESWECCFRKGQVTPFSTWIQWPHSGGKQERLKLKTTCITWVLANFKLMCKYIQYIFK